MKFKRAKAGIRQFPVVRVELLESRVLYSADVLSGLGINLPSAADDLDKDHDWSPLGEQGTVLPVGESRSVGFETVALNNSPQLAETILADSDGLLADDGTQLVKELIFIDARTPDYESMVNDLRANRPDTEIEIVIIDSDEDGIDKISATLASVDSVTAMHIISFGNGSAVQLGSVILDDAVLNARGDELLLWSGELSEDADILIYGCNLASTEAGVALIDNIAMLTDADVAASDDHTCLLYTSPSPRDRG